ncbi:hypothetical protein BGZ46_010082 [Entomortierella lignicola]|nr:hypothetical protein BGZ46_010082 [Entomortierella lignicola]
MERPRLSPLPYIYLRNLPYKRSTDLQQRLVERQIRLRKEQEDRKSLENLSNSSVSTELARPAEDQSNDLILIVEHTPTYTNGRRNRGAQAVSDKEVERLEGQGAMYVESLRGGEITFHGPGQIVAYPILDLKPIQLSVRCYVSYLEKAIIATCAEWNVKAITTENTGVWINDQKKIAAIEIVACGLVGKETTSLSRELNDPSIDVQKVIPTFLKGFGTTFNRELVPLSEANPGLEKLIREYVEFGDKVIL